MEKYKLTFGIEPTNEYNKAKQDMIQALNSFEKLTPQQKEMLAREIFGVVNLKIACDILQNHYK